MDSVTMEIQDILERFQAFTDPKSGAVRVEAYWVKVVTDPPAPPIVGPLEQGFSRSYATLAAADESALAFPGFAELAEQFAEAPFTAFAALLEAIRLDEQAKEAERLAQLALNRPQPPQEPS